MMIYKICWRLDSQIYATGCCTNTLPQWAKKYCSKDSVQLSCRNIDANTALLRLISFSIGIIIKSENTSQASTLYAQTEGLLLP